MYWTCSFSRVNYLKYSDFLKGTTIPIDSGLSTTMLWTFEERDRLLNAIECLSGSRYHALFLFQSFLWLPSHIYYMFFFLEFLLIYYGKAYWNPSTL